RMPLGYKESFNQFVEELHQKLTSLDKSLVIAIPPARGQNKYDLKTLNQYVDQYVMLGYNYHYKGSKEPGPISPLLYKKEWGDFNVQQGVSEYLAHGVPRAKLIVSFPYYGAKWKVKTVGGKEEYSFVEYPEIREIPELVEGEDVDYDDKTATAYCRYVDAFDGQEYIIYFDDAKTLKQKYAWVQSQKLAGIGMWTLGYDQGTDEYWNLLESEVNTLKNYGFNYIVHDSVSEFQSPLNERVAKADIRKILKQSEVQIVILCMIVFFAVLGLFLALTSSSVFDRVLILEFHIYLKVMGIFLALMILLLTIARFVFRTEESLGCNPKNLITSESVQSPLYSITLIGFLIITAISWKSFMRLNKDVP
ncbi:MAG: glycoside hydrolase family 18 protein, partial [bacterium]|nr:glycoside hydrolase family 18 protein [bacterium]